MPSDTTERIECIKAECERRGWMMLSLSKGNAIYPTSNGLKGMLNFMPDEKGLNLAEALLHATDPAAPTVEIDGEDCDRCGLSYCEHSPFAGHKPGPGCLGKGTYALVKRGAE